jgi:hypothetical protein
MTKEVTLRQAGGSVSATLPKDMADRLRLRPATAFWRWKQTAESC